MWSHRHHGAGALDSSAACCKGTVLGEKEGDDLPWYLSPGGWKFRKERKDTLEELAKAKPPVPPTPPPPPPTPEEIREKIEKLLLKLKDKARDI